MTLLDNKANLNDRISDLPSNVIDAILANLRIRDQVRTSILSKKWRYMWTSAPHLCFDDDFYQRLLHVDDDVVNEIIMGVLMLHNGPIHKFSVYVSGDYDFKISMENVNTWIPFMEKDIKHLELVTYTGYTTLGDEYQMPGILFSCKELTYFKFSLFNLSIPPNFRGFKKLRELHLDSIEFESSTLESFLSGCPLLEKLSIEDCTGCDYLVISSPSLKVLVLESSETNSICLKEAKNLIDFTLKGFLNKGFIKSLPEIKRFSLINWRKYEDTIPPMLPTSSFSSLEYLKLDDLNLNDKGDILYLVRVLKSAPSLIELVIKQSYNDDDTTQVSDHLKELKCRSCCLKLQTVDVYLRANSQYAMSLMQFILVNSPLLKILTFNYSSIELDAAMLFIISQDLLLMERASPRAQSLFSLCDEEGGCTMDYFLDDES